MTKQTVFVTLMGRPNVGKSTLLNALMKEKISIVSKKPQTTRNKITGILTESDRQYVFFDTPGMHTPKTMLGRYMTKSAAGTVGDADAAVLLVEPIKNIGKTEKDIIDRFKTKKIPLILAINKIDTVPKPEILELIELYSQYYDFASIIPISALNDDGVDILKRELDKYLAESEEFFFPEDITTDQTERQIICEVIREKALRLLDDEIPHGIAVAVDTFAEDEKKNLISVNVSLYCERENHKQIIIGKNGEMIKKIGSYAREDLEEFFGAKFFISIWVKVRENWRDTQYVLNDIGYRDN